jgi:hypothetical protein
MAIDTARKRRAAFCSRRGRAYQTPDNATSSIDRANTLGFYGFTPVGGPKVEIGFGSTWQTADASIVWTDVTDQVLDASRITASRGRRSLQDRFSTGSINLTLKNRTRLYDPTHTAGAYYGQLRPGVPVRVTTAPTGQTSRAVARGFISGWPQRYDQGNAMGYVPIQAYGIFDKVARAKLPQSVLDVEVLADTPVAFWKLDDNTEAEMLDSSGNDNHGSYDNPTLQQDGLVADGGKSVFFDHVGDHRGKFVGDLVTQFPMSIECWVKFARDLVAGHEFVTCIQDTTLRVGWLLECRPDNVGTPNPNGNVYWGHGGTAAVDRYVRGSTTVDDDAVHHVVIVCDGTALVDWTMYVDGAAETLTEIIAGTSISPWSNIPYWTVGNLIDSQGGDYGIAGSMDNVAIYDSALSAGRVLAHYNAGTSPWDGDTTDERLDRILDIVGLPADRRSFEACTTQLGTTVLGQQRALDYMRKVEASEDGRMFETADGKIRLLNRYWGLVDTHATSAQFAFSDVADVFYDDLQIDPDDELLVNICTVTRPDGAALTITNDTSIATYGPADTSIDVLLQTDAECRSLGEHVVLIRGTPQERVSKLRFALHGLTPVQQAAILDLEIGYRITVARTPQGVGSPISLALIIEGVEHQIDSYEHWVEFNVSVAPDATNAFVWGTSTWNTSTTWGW